MFAKVKSDDISVCDECGVNPVEWLHCHAVPKHGATGGVEYRRRFLCYHCHPQAMDNSGRTILKVVDDGRAFKSYHQQRLRCEHLRIANGE